MDVSMIAYDGSPNAIRAIDYASRYLASTRTFVVTAWETGTHESARIAAMSGAIPPIDGSIREYDKTLKKQACEINKAGVAMASAHGLHAEGRIIQVDTTVWGALVDAAEDLEVDILVIGTGGRTGLKGLLHNSRASAVLKRTHRPVLIVPPVCDQVRQHHEESHLSAAE